MLWRLSFSFDDELRKVLLEKGKFEFFIVSLSMHEVNKSGNFASLWTLMKKASLALIIRQLGLVEYLEIFYAHQVSFKNICVFHSRIYVSQINFLTHAQPQIQRKTFSYSLSSFSIVCWRKLFFNLLCLIINSFIFMWILDWIKDYEKSRKSENEDE